MPVARNNIWTCDLFATSSFNFGLPTYFVSHYCYGRALYAVFYRKVFFFKVEQSCWLWCGKWHVKGHTCFGVHCVHTMFLFCYFSLLWFIWKFKFVLLFQRLVSLSYKKTTIHINLLEWFFCEIDVCVYPPLFWLCLLSGILAPHDSNIDCHALRLLPILYCVYIYMPLLFTLGIISSVEGIWLGVPLMRSLVRSHIQLLRYSEKDNLCSLLDSGRQIFHWSKLTLLSPWDQPWVRGRSSGSFPEQRLVIEPKDNQPPHK